MLPSLGFVDTLRESGLRIYSANPNHSVANQFAAMPSLHFGWSVIVAATYVELRRTALSALAVLHPIITLFAIVVTANHYWMDAFIALILVVGVAAAFGWTRRGERPWCPGGRLVKPEEPNPTD